MNFVGFEELKGEGAPELLYNQIFIEPNQPQATSTGNIAAAGYVPGQQSYLKQRRAIWSKSITHHGTCPDAKDHGYEVLARAELFLLTKSRNDNLRTQRGR